MEGHLVMSAKERSEKVEFEGVGAGRMTIVDASEKLGLSYRLCWRSYKRFREQGDAGLVHRSRGRTSNRAKLQEFKNAVLARYRERYEGFGPVLATEKLAEDGYEVGRETLRCWLLEQGLWQPRRKGVRHRHRRERRAHFGELVQMDGSHHEWFEARGESAVLIAMIDDATSRLYARFFQTDSTEINMTLIRDYIGKYGRPVAIYADKASHFKTTRQATVEKSLRDMQAETQIVRAFRELRMNTNLHELSLNEQAFERKVWDALTWVGTDRSFSRHSRWFDCLFDACLVTASKRCRPVSLSPGLV